MCKVYICRCERYDRDWNGTGKVYTVCIVYVGEIETGMEWDTCTVFIYGIRPVHIVCTGICRWYRSWNGTRHIYSVYSYMYVVYRDWHFTTNKGTTMCIYYISKEYILKKNKIN